MIEMSSIQFRRISRNVFYFKTHFHSLACFCQYLVICFNSTHYSNVHKLKNTDIVIGTYYNYHFLGLYEVVAIACNGYFSNNNNKCSARNNGGSRDNVPPNLRLDQPNQILKGQVDRPKQLLFG